MSPELSFIEFNRKSLFVAHSLTIQSPRDIQGTSDWLKQSDPSPVFRSLKLVGIKYEKSFVRRVLNKQDEGLSESLKKLELGLDYMANFSPG